MKTIEISREVMEKRIARFSDLKPLPIQQDESVPAEAKELVYAKKLMSVIGLETETDTPINAAAPIIGAAGMTMTHAICPPGQGPSLHAHQQTYETFTVLKGRFEFSWNDDGSEKTVLEPFDTISVPPKVNRRFQNVGDEEGILQVVITGGVHDMSDIDIAPAVAAKLDEMGSGVRAYFENVGLTFNAHKNAND